MFRTGEIGEERIFYSIRIYFKVVEEIIEEISRPSMQTVQKTKETIS